MPDTHTIQANEQSRINRGRLEFLPQHQGRTITRIDNRNGNPRTYDVEDVGTFRSVTSSANILNKPAIAGWTKNVALTAVSGTLNDEKAIASLEQDAAIKNAQYEQKGKSTRITWVDLLINQASGAPYQATNIAQEFGHKSHKVIEDILMSQWQKSVEELDAIDPEYAHVAEGFLMWQAQSNIEVVASELMVWHPEYEYAGTIDLVGRLDNGTLAVIDIKTGGVYNEAAYQLAAYATALEYLTEEPVTEALVLQLPRVRPTDEDADTYYNVMVVDSIPYWFNQFELMHKLAPCTAVSAFTQPL